MLIVGSEANCSISFAIQMTLMLNIFETREQTLLQKSCTYHRR
jgi:hypothetical protein